MGNTVRVTRPSRSNPRNVSVSMRCEMLAIERRSSLNRLGPISKRDDHEHAPLIAHAVENLAYGTALLGHIQVTG